MRHNRHLFGWARRTLRQFAPALGMVPAAALAVAPAVAQPISVEVGLTDLITRLGLGNQPTGAGVVVSQVEAGGANYGPDQLLAEFAGKTFTAQSGPPGLSGHATTVGTFMYGNTFSIAPGVTSINLYETNSWLFAGYLQSDQGGLVAPLPTPGGIKTFNHSWVGSFGSSANDNIVNRRADFAIRRDQILMTVGVNCCNGQPHQPLLSHTYNGIAVGLMTPTHTSGPTLAGGNDGPGRMKPEIVAPGSSTSYSTPVVNGAAALLVQTARTTPALMSNVNAERADVLKSILLAGANHRPGWSNNPPASGPSRGITATPLDPIYGVDVVNVNKSHMIITGLEQSGSTAVPTSPNIQARGWDHASVTATGSQFYRFHLGAVADKLSVVATWQRIVTSNFVSFTLANFNLHLWRVGPGNTLISLTGDDGLPYFGGGNVVSQSAVDNVEHLYLTNLQPGNYVLEVKRVDVLGGSRDVAVAWIMPETPQLVPGDLNGDGMVNVDDLLMLLAAWGPCPTCPADLNGDGLVNVDDLLILLANWG